MEAKVLNLEKVKERLLSSSRKGYVSGTVQAVIAAAVTIFVGIWVLSTVVNSIDTTNFTSQANQTYSQVQNTTWSAITLLTVGLIVLAAVVILGIFRGR